MTAASVSPQQWKVRPTCCAFIYMTSASQLALEGGSGSSGLDPGVTENWMLIRHVMGGIGEGEGEGKGEGDGG